MPLAAPPAPRCTTCPSLHRSRGGHRVTLPTCTCGRPPNGVRSRCRAARTLRAASLYADRARRAHHLATWRSAVWCRAAAADIERHVVALLERRRISHGLKALAASLTAAHDVRRRCLAVALLRARGYFWAWWEMLVEALHLKARAAATPSIAPSRRGASPHALPACASRRSCTRIRHTLPCRPLPSLFLCDAVDRRRDGRVQQKRVKCLVDASAARALSCGRAGHSPWLPSSDPRASSASLWGGGGRPRRWARGRLSEAHGASELVPSPSLRASTAEDCRKLLAQSSNPLLAVPVAP